ncbi:MAG: transcriptional repressor LexA [Candidatus Krumholzibacteriota bacterium]|nr:transcriptional repressor LexA [Candidatus Krumholzibacteriota bacterium]
MVYLTRRQKEILDFIEAFQGENGYAPSLEEIAAHFGLSAVSTVHEHLSNLSAKGMLMRGSNRARSIEPVVSKKRQGSSTEVMLAGTVAAGSPIEALEVPETVALPPGLAGRAETFALRVRGLSMTGDGILDGDMIIVEKVERVSNGTLAVALIDGSEATVKRFYQRGAVVTLRPSNPDMDDIVLSASRVEIMGRVTGLIRDYRQG